MSSCCVVGVLDADFFEVQVYQKLPQCAPTIGRPCVVALRTGRILSVSTEAKQFGITRQMNVYQAQRKCRGLSVIMKQDRFTKPETKMLNEHSYGIRSAILDFLRDSVYEIGEQEGLINVEKVGNDEYFLDLTDYVDALQSGGYGLELDTTKRIFVEGDEKRYKGRQLAHRVRNFYSDEDNGDEEEVRLAFGTQIIQELCDYIENRVQIMCSGGVASNKLLAKLACKLNKPNGVTVLTRNGFLRVSPNVSFREITGFGGDLGKDIAAIFGENSIEVLRTWLKKPGNFRALVNKTDHDKAQLAKRLVNGVCHEDVENKLMFDGMNCRRNYLNIESQADFNRELNYLSQHMKERLQEEVEYNKRFATGIQIQYFHRLRNGFIKKESFNMEFSPTTEIDHGGEGQLTYSESEFFQEALGAVMSDDRFCNHLKFIKGICFSVTGFDQFGDVE